MVIHLCIYFKFQITFTENDIKWMQLSFEKDQLHPRPTRKQSWSLLAVWPSLASRQDQGRTKDDKPCCLCADNKTWTIFAWHYELMTQTNQRLKLVCMKDEIKAISETV